MNFLRNRSPAVKLVFFLVFFAILGFMGWVIRGEKYQLFFNIFRAKETAAISRERKYSCRISGEVHYPGSYRLRRGAKISDLINAAGGLTSRADTSAINLTEILNDGTELIIPPTGNLIRRLGIGKGPEEDYIIPPVIVEKAQ
ncbi:MAG: SLBB domain-containing protein [Elusimicrobiota bacterium]